MWVSFPATERVIAWCTLLCRWLRELTVGIIADRETPGTGKISGIARRKPPLNVCKLRAT